MNRYIHLLLWEEWHWRQKSAAQSGIRANTKEDIKEIQSQVDLPIIGIVKRDYADSENLYYSDNERGRRADGGQTGDYCYGCNDFKKTWK